MQPIAKDEIDRLLREEGTPCISLYMRTYRGARETKQNPIRFRNLTRSAADSLGQMGVTTEEQNALLGPLHELADDHDFWQHQDCGLAVLRSRNLFRTFPLPDTIEELVVVQDRFHVKPLLGLVPIDGRFYVLELHVHRTRLFEADRFEMHEVDLGDAPRTLEDAVGHEVEQQMIQYHSDRLPPDRSHVRSRHGGRPIYHGQGGGEPEEEKREIRQWLTVLRDHVDAKVGDRQAPLVLVGSEPLFPLFREASELNVLEEGVHEKNEIDEREIHTHSRGVADRYFAREVDEAKDRIPALERRGLASGELEDVVVASIDGRVRTLFVSRDEHAWGRFDPESREVRRMDAAQPGADDLLDLAAVNTFVNGGRVWVLPTDRVPSGAPLAAVYRY